MATTTTFVALRCYACGMFQVKQLKRSGNKWSCCICNEKQSVCKVYGRSDAAKDVRKLVQALNLSNRQEQPSIASETTQDEVREEPGGPAGVPCRASSKWKEFLDEDVTHPECLGDGDEEGAGNYVTVLPEIRLSKRKAFSGCCARRSKATSRASVENNSSSSISAGSLKQLEMPAFFKSDTSKDLKLEPAAEKENLLPPCNEASIRLMTLTAARDETRENNVAVRGQYNKYVAKSSRRKWNEYLEDEQKQQQDELGSISNSSSSKVSGVYRKWSTFQQELCLGGVTEIGTELEDEVVAEDDVHPSFLL